MWEKTLKRARKVEKGSGGAGASEGKMMRRGLSLEDRKR